MMFCLKSHGCQPNCMFFGVFFACFGCYWPLFFHISNRGWGQLPGHAANVCNWPLLTSKTRCSTGLEPLHTSLVMSGLILGCLDWTGRPYCWARHVSSSYTSWLFLLGLCQRHGVYKTAVNDIDYLKKKEKNPRICEIGDCWHNCCDLERTP